MRLLDVVVGKVKAGFAPFKALVRQNRKPEPDRLGKIVVVLAAILLRVSTTPSIALDKVDFIYQTVVITGCQPQAFSFAFQLATFCPLYGHSQQ